MIYFNSENGEFAGHIGDRLVKGFTPSDYQNVTKVQADGDELQRCCAILSRSLPPNRVYTFLGDNAKEIAANWY
jgi:hypothetical protein